MIRVVRPFDVALLINVSKTCNTNTIVIDICFIYTSIWISAYNLSRCKIPLCCNSNTSCATCDITTFNKYALLGSDVDVFAS